MTYVVTSACVGCKDTECVTACPVDAFREGPDMLVIDPSECIDCDLCVDECPVDAIFEEHDVPADQIPFITLNAKLSQLWPMIDTTKEALAQKSPYTVQEALDKYNHE